MAKNQEMLSLMAMPMPKTERDWQQFLVRMATINFRSGLTSFDDTENAGWFFGFDEDGVAVAVIGDRGAGKFIEWDGTDLNIGANVVPLT